jgi:chloramphenicol-sensitive protein RarD
MSERIDSATASNLNNPGTSKAAGGLGAAVLAYVIWGFFPIYFHPLLGVPAIELVSWRVVFTLVCLAVVWPAARARPAHSPRRCLAGWC